MLFMSKQVSLPKISSILQKMKIGQKSDIRPFSTKAFNCHLEGLRTINESIKLFFASLQSEMKSAPCYFSVVYLLHFPH